METELTKWSADKLKNARPFHFFYSFALTISKAENAFILASADTPCSANEMVIKRVQRCLKFQSFLCDIQKIATWKRRNMLIQQQHHHPKIGRTNEINAMQCISFYIHTSTSLRVLCNLQIKRVLMIKFKCSCWCCCCRCQWDNVAVFYCYTLSLSSSVLLINCDKTRCTPKYVSGNLNWKKYSRCDNGDGDDE